MDENEKAFQRRLRVSRWVFLGALVAVLTVYFLKFGGTSGGFSNKQDIWGQFGDYVGGILNPLIAGLALYWLTESVQIQRRELSETRQALQESAKAQAQQVAASATVAKLNVLNAELETVQLDINAVRENLHFLVGQIHAPRAYSPAGEHLRTAEEIFGMLEDLRNALQGHLKRREEVVDRARQALAESQMAASTAASA
jgi:hypothetical protein